MPDPVAARKDPRYSTGAKILVGLLGLVLLTAAAIGTFATLTDNSDETELRGGAASSIPPELVRGELVAGDVRLLPLPAPGALADHAGERVTGKDLYVRGTSRGGLWIAANARDPDVVYVRMPDRAGGHQRGDRAGLTGVVRSARQGPGDLELTPRQERLIRAAGGYIVADRVS